METILSTPTKRRQQLQPEGLATPTMSAQTLGVSPNNEHRYNTRSRSPSPAAPRSPAADLADSVSNMRLAASPARGAKPAPRSPALDAELAEMSLGVLAAAAAAVPPVAPQSASHSSTGLIYDARCLLHQANYAHVEQPARASATMTLLQSRGLYQRCVHIPTRPARDDEIINQAHTQEHLSAIDATAQFDYKEDEADSETEGDATLYPDCKWLDTDTYVNRHSGSVAKLAIGGLIELMEAVVDGRVRNGFAVIRPPGHHADAVKAQGFCLYNNVAVGVQALRASRGSSCRRVLIVDWDVHHGNGTQNIFYSDPDVLYFSIHRYQSGAFYPHTGAHDEVGPPGTPAEGRNINIPLNFKGLGDEEYLAIFRTVLLPVLREFGPDLVVVSAGFDCAQGDPLGGMEVSSEAFGHMTRMLAEGAPGGRVVMALEGGYNVRAVSEAVCACVSALLGDPLEPLPDAHAFLGKRELAKLAARKDNFRKDLALCVDLQKKYWKCLRLEGDKGGATVAASAAAAAAAPASVAAAPASAPVPAAAVAAEKKRPAVAASVSVSASASVTIAPPAAVPGAAGASSAQPSPVLGPTATPLPSPAPIIGPLSNASPSPAPIAVAAAASPSPFGDAAAPSPSPFGGLAAASSSPFGGGAAAASTSPFGVVASATSSPFAPPSASAFAPTIFVSPPSSVAAAAIRPNPSTLVRHDSDVVMQ